MNKVILDGRLTKDPTLIAAAGDKTSVCNFTLAVYRKGNADSDFILCNAFGKTAEFICDRFHKGSRIMLEGNLHTGSYVNKEGVKIYTWGVFVENIEQIDYKKSSIENQEAVPEEP